MKTKRGLGIAVTALFAIALSALFWALNYWQRYFVDSLAGRKFSDFVFAIQLVLIFLLVGSALSFAKEWWLGRWTNILREQRFRDLSSLYFSGATFSWVEARLPGANATQRLVDDVREWAKDLVAIQFGGISSAVSALFFGFTLWGVVPELALAGLNIYGPMLWFSMVLFALTSSLLHLVGRRMPDRESRRANAEGQFRESLTRTREHARSIALLNGSEREHGDARSKLANASIATFHLALLRARLSACTFLLGPSDILAWVVLSTFYFRGEISLGQIFQGAMAHSAMGSALGWMYSHYEDIARLRAADKRLVDWRESVARLAADSTSKLQLGTADVLSVSGVRIFIPEAGEQAGRALRIPDFMVAAGESALLQAQSGFGKSLLLSVIAGVWPWAAGSVTVPHGAVWVPQRPFFPQADLATAVSYPGPSKFGMGEVAAALERVNLSHLLAFGSGVIDWNNTLSGGELSRLAIVRAVLQRPRWLFLDEATAALDAAAAKACWTWLREIENMTIVAISHEPVDSVDWSRVIDLTACEATLRLQDAASGGR